MPEIKNVCINAERNIKLNLTADDALEAHADKIKAVIESFTEQNPIDFENYGFGYYKLALGEKSFQFRDIIPVSFVLNLCDIDINEASLQLTIEPLNSPRP